MAEQLPKKESSSPDTDLNDRIFEAYSLVRLASLQKLEETEPGTHYREHLDLLCERLIGLMFSISAKLNAAYFSHTTYQYHGSKGGFQFEV